MNAKDMITLLEYVKAFDKAPKKRFGKTPKTPKLDLVALLREKKEEAELLEKFLKDQEKINKKEEKKDDKKPVRSLTFAEGVIIAYLAQFILGPLYQAYVASVSAVH